LIFGELVAFREFLGQKLCASRTRPGALLQVLQGAFGSLSFCPKAPKIPLIVDFVFHKNILKFHGWEKVI
jgi:hypothetical protein